MTEKLKIELTTVEIEAIIKSLDLAGVVDGDAKTLLNSFHDQSLVQGARKSHRYLRHLLDSQATRKRAYEADILREKENDTAVATIKKNLREARIENNKLKELYYPIHENITRAISEIKSSNSNPAIKKLESCLEGIDKACPIRDFIR